MHLLRAWGTEPPHQAPPWAQPDLAALEVLDNKLVSDMLWADPKTGQEGWSDNLERGISYYYGRNVVDYFLARNGFSTSSAEVTRP
jgi:hypothetical protein